MVSELAVSKCFPARREEGGEMGEMDRLGGDKETMLRRKATWNKQNPTPDQVLSLSNFWLEHGTFERVTNLVASGSMLIGTEGVRKGFSTTYSHCTLVSYWPGLLEICLFLPLKHHVSATAESGIPE